MPGGTKKTKVAQVITRLDWGGPPDIIRLICDSLDLNIFDVRLITGISLYPSLETRNFLERFSNRVITIPQLKRDINPLSDIVALLRLYRLFRKEDFDIVHTHTAKAGALGRLAARFAGVPKIVHTSHGHNFYGYFGPVRSKLVVMVERFISYFTDKINALTELEKQDLASYKVAQPAKIVVINSGLELDRYRKININAGEKRNELRVGQDTILVGMIGRLEPVKGPEYFIEAARLITEKFPEVKFIVAGDGSLRSKLEFQCEKLHISDKLIFIGWREDIPEILSVLDILVMPSLNEAVGRILIEAGACGKPVVATRVGGIPEVVKDNQTGILVPPKDAYELARAVISLLEDKNKRQRMGETAKNWVDDKFSASRMVKGFSDLYDEMQRR
ncbi:MAG: glycosyltransferase family 4 protein [Thermodesulfovibrionia bacterium]|nr:glycosyltransferase family 4 protein [Thermodesulfovibrionia bacterium]